MLQLGSFSQWGPLAASMVLLAWVVLRRSFRQRTAEAVRGSRPLVRYNSAAEVDLTDAPATALRWQLAMFELCRSMKGELDSKMAACNALAAVAREERLRLESAVAQARQLGIAPCEDTLLAVEQLALDSDEVACRRIADLVATTGARIENGPLEPKRLSEIYALAESGQSPTEIAMKLEMPVGDIELAISLRSPP